MSTQSDILTDAATSPFSVLVASTPAPADSALDRAVFERFPFGLLITGPDGVVQRTNDAARALMNLPIAAGKHSCCEMFGCHGEESPLGGECVSALALRVGLPLPDVRMDVPGESDRAVWVVAAPLDAGHVLLQIRPADLKDRRRRTEPHWLSGPELTIRTLGRTSVSSAEGSIDGAWLGQRPGQLLKLLVAQRGTLSHADQILGRFWPDGGRGAMVNLRHCVFSLRKRLEPSREAHSSSSFVVARDGGYTLDLRIVQIDADEFEAAADHGLSAWAQGEAEVAQPPLERAAELYAGEFLADEPYAEWAFAERDRLHELACRVLRALAALREAGGDQDGAVEALARLVEIEPFDSEGQKRLLGLLIDLRRNGEAVRRYKLLRSQWLDEFGAPPEFDVRSLRGEAA